MTAEGWPSSQSQTGKGMCGGGMSDGGGGWRVEGGGRGERS